MPQATAAELEAILYGCAVAPLADRAFLRITGSDATRWLNGMVTNSIQALEPGEGNYNFLLNAQGRIQADCTIYREPHENEPTFLLETDSSQMETVQETLDRFIIMDDVELHPSADHERTVLLLGPQATHLLRTWGLPEAAPLRLLASAEERGQVTTPVPGPVPQFELHGTELVANGLLASAIAAGAVEVSPAALDAVRILSGTPHFGQDIRDRDLPQETNQTHALHFSKGCYLGQEIVERIRSRGQVHRQFTRFRLVGELPTEFPAALSLDGKPAGELTSAALVPLPTGAELLAVGYARREFLETSAATEKELAYPGGTANPRSASETLTRTT